MTTTEITAIADKHLDNWFAADPQTDTTSLRQHVEAAISEALERQAANFAAGTATIKHERDRALAELAAVRQRILGDNKAYGCELRDPSGTIWEYAEELKKQLAELSAARPITEEDPPQFPCWMWSPNVARWARFDARYRGHEKFASQGCTHWHPDQPIAPKDAP